MSNRDLFRLWAEAYTVVITAQAVGVDYLKTVIQKSGKGDQTWLLSWVSDFRSYMRGNEHKILSYVYLPNTKHKYSDREIEKTEEAFWKRLGGRRDLFVSEAKRFRRLLS